MKIRTRARKQLKPSKPAINQASTVSDNAKDYVSFLDPQKICVGTIPNRHADSYDAESFESLRLSIQCAVILLCLRSQCTSPGYGHEMEPGFP